MGNGDGEAAARVVFSGYKVRGRVAGLRAAVPKHQDGGSVRGDLRNFRRTAGTDERDHAFSGFCQAENRFFLSSRQRQAAEGSRFSAVFLGFAHYRDHRFGLRTADPFDFFFVPCAFGGTAGEIVKGNARAAQPVGDADGFFSLAEDIPGSEQFVRPFREGADQRHPPSRPQGENAVVFQQNRAFPRRVPRSGTVLRRRIDRFCLRRIGRIEQPQFGFQEKNAPHRFVDCGQGNPALLHARGQMTDKQVRPHVHVQPCEQGVRRRVRSVRRHAVGNALIYRVRVADDHPSEAELIPQNVFQ